MRHLIVLGLCALLVVMATADRAEAVSQAGGIGLQFPIGARYNALGEAGTALSTDISALWWNPGGFAFAADAGYRRGIHFMYSKLAAGLADDVSLNWIGFGTHLEGWGMLGVSFTYLNQGEQTATEEETGTVLGTFNSYQWSLGLTYGAKLTDKLGLGVGVKYFRDELAPDEFTKDNASGSGSTWAVDLGVNYRLLEPLAIGAAVTNLGPDITFVDADQSDPMPRNVRLGAAYDPIRTPITSVTLIGDYLISLVPDDETKVLGIGAEWGYLESLFVRAGYKDDPEGKIQAWTAGGGVDLQRWIGRSMSFDYANVPQAEDLERVHRFSLAFLF
jgi:hypothetical protein